MEKKLAMMVLTGVLALSVAGCGETATGSVESSEGETTIASEEVAKSDSISDVVGLSNPWRDCTEDEAYQVAPNLFSAPEGAENVKWSMMGEEGEDSDGRYVWPLVQMTFELYGNKFTAREQLVGDEAYGISGLYYNWTVKEDVTLEGWGGGRMQGKTYRYIGEDKYVDLITWFDIETGANYSLSVEAEDLDGFDIQAVAEAMYDESKQIGASISEDEEVPKPSVDTSDCAGIDDVIGKLSSDMAYARTTINGSEVLLVTDYTYLWEEGVEAAIDSEIYYCPEEGTVSYIGIVEAGGTAYPLAVKDEKLYIGGNHSIQRYTISDGVLFIEEESYVRYDTDGNATYYHHSDLYDVESDDDGQVPDESFMTALYSELEGAEIISFTVIK